MVFSINPTADKTHAQFQAAAIQQNGNGAGSAITGDAPPPDQNAGASASATAPAATTPAGDAGNAANTGVATGTGQIAADGSCVCAVQCSVGGGFPAAVQGRDSFGGFGGEFYSSLFDTLNGLLIWYLNRRRPHGHGHASCCLRHKRHTQHILMKL
jgi:hypothetical protein